MVTGKDDEIAKAKVFLQETTDRMQREKVVALEMQVEGRERMRLALQKTIAERERHITEIHGSGQPLQLPPLQFPPL